MKARLVTDCSKSDRWHQQTTAVPAERNVRRPADRQQEPVDPSTAAHFREKLCTSVGYGDLVFDLLRDTQPLNTGKSVDDVVCVSHLVDELCRCYQH